MASQRYDERTFRHMTKVLGKRTADLVLAMLTFGEEYALANTTEDDDLVIAQARLSHRTFEAQGGPPHDREDREGTQGFPGEPGAQP